jgi:ATP-dependent DNA helicase RecG
VPEFGVADEQGSGPQEAQSGQSRTQVTGEVTGEVAGEVTGEVHSLLKALEKKALTRAEAQAALELKGQANFRDRYLAPALGAGLIEMTIPEKSKSSKQKYQLTDTGRQVLTRMQGGVE